MKKPTATWRRENDALVVDVPYDANANWEQWVFLRADSHHDSIHCDQNLERRHLEEAKRKNALILDGGDLFDAMQGTGDKRSSKRELREEYKTDKYFDALVDHAARFYAPYSQNWVLMGLGNHETAVIKWHNTDLTERLCDRLRYEHNSAVVKGSYENYVRFDFRSVGTGSKKSKVLYHHHGYGGGARVTKGVIDFQRIFVEIPTADFLFMGHIHNENIFTVPCEELTVENNRRKRKRYGIRVAGYKDEHGKGGWHDERGHGVRPLGGAWIRFFWDRSESKVTEEVFTTSA